MANMKMTNSIRKAVSKKRKRYVGEGFNLDLTYITERLIAMGFPSEKLESIYRNPIDEVVQFFDAKHKNKYKIYNLCSERSYDAEKFQRRVAVYPFNDHSPPRIELVRRFCEDVHRWLAQDPENVAAVHCKAGKGRTGTMICCYLLHCGLYEEAQDALGFYGRMRTYDMKGVTIPSQRRYVHYYAELLRTSRAKRTPCLELYSPPAILIDELRLEPPPALNGGQGALEFCVHEGKQSGGSQRISLGVHEARKGSASVRVRPDRCTPLVGDVKVEVFHLRPKITLGKQKLFHFWFNTFFVDGRPAAGEASENGAAHKLTFNKFELDDAHKDTQNKLYGSNFKVELTVQFVPENSAWGSRAQAAGAAGPLASPPSPPSPSSSGAEEDESDESLEPEEGWDSAADGAGGGTGALLGHYRVLSETELDDDISAGNGAAVDVERMPQRA